MMQNNHDTPVSIVLNIAVLNATPVIKLQGVLIENKLLREEYIEIFLPKIWSIDNCFN